MKFIIFLGLTMMLTLNSCVAQKNALEITGANSGNTGLRGIIPRDENGNEMPMPKGNDYFQIFIKANKRVTVEAVSLITKGMDGQTAVFQPAFTEGGKKRVIEAGETVTLRADKNKDSPKAADLTTGAGLLTVRMGKKKFTYTVKQFDFILPQ